MAQNTEKIEDVVLADIPTVIKTPNSGLARIFTSPVASMALTAILMITLFAASFFIAYQSINKQKPPQNYEECTKAKGSVIRESYPAVCVTKGGKEFIQPLSEEEQRLLDLQVKENSEGTNDNKLGEAATKEECDQKGGVWQKWGLAGLEYCQIPATDAGKSCTNGSQCSLGKCISEEGELPGKCQTYKNTFGCFSYVEDGKVSGAICVD